MLSLHHRIAQANALLAPFAVPHGGGMGRAHGDEPDETRFPFQRDRDRILHTQAFRRLKQKTQVFVAGHGDHYRTRITHTIEVAQISRDTARALALNEDLSEAIALAHDLGHTPFGHAGEEQMRDCLQPYSKPFEHNEQSLRIVTLLEHRSSKYLGLNLSREILEGLRKHRERSQGNEQSLSLEAQIVNLADEIAYSAHDTDDGLRAKQFSVDDLRSTTLAEAAYQHAALGGTEIRGALVYLLLKDLLTETERRLQEENIRTLDDVYASKTTLVGFSASMEKNLHELRTFLWNRLYISPSVLKQARHGKRVIRTLFTHYMKRPPEKVKLLQKKTGGALEEAVKDYIAGMTDPYALQCFEKMVTA